MCPLRWTHCLSPKLCLLEGVWINESGVAISEQLHRANTAVRNDFNPDLLGYASSFYAHHRKIIFLDGRGCALFLCVVVMVGMSYATKHHLHIRLESYPGAAARKKEELF